MPSLVKAQIEGASFLANNDRALLADEPGFGKSAQAVAAADFIFADTILVLTTASARENWLNEFATWSSFGRKGFAALTTTDTIPRDASVVVVAWSNFTAPIIWQQIRARRWSALIVDESHYASNIVPGPADLSAVVQRTLALYGKDGLIHSADVVWPLTGTPVPNAPDDLYPMLRALFPQRIKPYTEYRDYVARFCLMEQKRVGRRTYSSIKGGKNEDELREILAPIMLRRKLNDLPPIRYNTFLIHAGTLPDESDLDRQAILDAAATGDTRALDIHLGTLRRLTGILKAHACADLVKDELTNGLDKIVLFAWHREVLDSLEGDLKYRGVARLDGSTPASEREDVVWRFQTDPKVRVFLGQIQAAGEAITLTAANQILFVEGSFIPKDMQQAVRRILRRGQQRPCLCRVAALSGSIDEALMRIVTRKVESIRSIVDEE